MDSGNADVDLMESIKALNEANAAFRTVLERFEFHEHQYAHYDELFVDTIERFLLVKSQIKRYEKFVDNLVVQIGKETVKCFKLSDKMRFDVMQINEMIEKQDTENEVLEGQLQDLVSKLQKLERENEQQARARRPASGFRRFLQRWFR